MLTLGLEDRGLGLLVLAAHQKHGDRHSQKRLRPAWASSQTRNNALAPFSVSRLEDCGMLVAIAFARRDLLQTGACGVLQPGGGLL